jgi:putative glutamine amidotransferase
MTKPFIGLNVDVDVTKPEQVRIARAYYEAVEKAGGVAVLIPPCKPAAMRAILDRLDGVLLIGGRDYDPAFFGEASHESVALLHPDRIKFDLALAKEAIKRNLPVLGICGGLQLINIALGGSLIIDIPTYLATGKIKTAGSNAGGDKAKGASTCAETPSIKHRATEGTRRAEHPASVIRDSLLFSIYGSVIAVTVSSHHQAANRLGRRLKAVAFAPDGIIEAIEHRFRRFVVGVQWHPERDFAGNRRLFRAFIEACKSTKRRA